MKIEYHNNWNSFNYKNNVVYENKKDIITPLKYLRYKLGESLFFLTLTPIVYSQLTVYLSPFSFLFFLRSLRYCYYSNLYFSSSIMKIELN